jgi:hypothetical protein
VSNDPNGDPRQEPAESPRPGRKWAAGVAALVVVFVGLAGYDLISGGAALAGRPAASRTAAPPTPRAAAAAQSATPVASPAPSASSSAGSSPAPSSAAGVLTVGSAAAYGPDGTSDGDHPDLASGIINDGDGQPWHSSWYASATFGNLQSGTGLLLDMGETVTVSSLRLVLGSTAGADVQIRIGNLSGSGELPVAASASDVSGTVQLPVTDPASGQYVLIWFTRLPLDSPGKYQVSVYSAAVYGTKGTLFAAPGPMSSTKGDAFRSYSITIQS